MSKPLLPDDSTNKYVDDALGVQKLLAGGCGDKLIMQLTGVSADELRRIKNLLG